MNKQDQQEFKSLVVEAMSSEGGKNAIVDAMHSMDGQEAIKRGALAALKSDEGKDILLDNFVDSFHQIADELFVDQDKKIKGLEDRLTSLESKGGN